MAHSPSHRFGQDLGHLLEYVVLFMILKPRLEEFTQNHQYFLDWQTERPVRPGKKKVTWQDQYANSHDLDFVIEAGGTPHKVGTPVAFIEAAWRRYTKHSKNKVQEIQGAILPIVALHKLSAPFHGAVLAGDFSKASLDQLRNNRFTVLYIPYKDVVNAFKAVELDIAFDEATPDAVFAQATEKLTALSVQEKDTLRNALLDASKAEVEQFMDALRKTLERFIIQVMLVPMFGREVKVGTLDAALSTLDALDITRPVGRFQKIEIIVDYNNADTIRASFTSVAGAADFLSSLRR